MPRHPAAVFPVIVCAVVAANAIGAEPTTKSPAASEASFTAEQIEYFESKVRPLLVRECYECHSGKAAEPKANLRLDSRAAALEGGDSGPAIVVGRPQESPMIRAVRWLDSEMPPRGKLQAGEIAALEKWVTLGAPWPADEQTSTEAATGSSAAGKHYDFAKARAEHWAWRAVERPPLPAVRNPSWAKNEIDLFVAAKLEAAGLVPSPPAEPRVLLRRLYLDLVGLPPTPEALAEFEQACSVAATNGTTAAAATSAGEAAYRAVVEQLLASPQYGERWGRYWLDVARYSDGYGGFLDKQALPFAWRYRDWVVDALNADMPYDAFVRLQIAGDLIDRKQVAATGFLSLGPTYISDGGDPEAAAQARSETLDDRVDTVCRGLLGVTLACARCHDHRFDPLPQADYYAIAGVFSNTRSQEVPLSSPAEVRAYEAFHKQLKSLETEERDVRAATRKENRDLKPEELQRSKELKSQIAEMKAREPRPLDTIHAVAEAGSVDMPLAVRGNLLRPGPKIPRHFLQIASAESPAPFTKGSGRLELADAIVDPQNPLTSRVVVNRVWQQHFGFGLVRTPSNFGTLGEKPSHPELLDWLAWQFVRQPIAASPDSAGRSAVVGGWSLKSLHRAIVTSATYRQASTARDDGATVDGDNRLLWRMSPRRLDVEAWRDSLLVATGELDLTSGGPSIEDIAASRRRTLYAAVSRNGDKFASDAFLRLFDFPVPRATSEGRTASVVPQQSLFLMNSRFIADRARAFADRLQREEKAIDQQIARAYLLAYGRPVTDDERRLGLEFLKSAATGNDGLQAWRQYAQVLLSAGELMYWE